MNRRVATVLTACALAVGVACSEPGPSPEEVAAEAARQAELEAAAAARRERLEADRLAALWTYNETTMAGARQVSAQIRSANNVDTDGTGAKSILLVFRDHASWGRSSYLVLQSGDFACAPRCTVAVAVDDGEPTTMAARRPDTDDAIAMFIDDAAALWRATAGASRISIEFPVRAGGTRTATFDVAGLDESKLPGWS